MTAAEFRANPELVKGMRAILADPIMQAALEVMADEHPVKVLTDENATPQYIAIQSGRSSGYETYDYRLKLLGRGIEIPQTTPPADYADDQPQPEE